MDAAKSFAAEAQKRCIRCKQTFFYIFHGNIGCIIYMYYVAMWFYFAIDHAD